MRAFAINVTTAPAAEPISVAEAKTHLGIAAAITHWDTFLGALIKAAREVSERYTGRAWIAQTITMTADGFPRERAYMELPRPPLASVTSVSYVDLAGASQTWSSADYTVDTRGKPGRVALAIDETWPDTAAVANAVTVVYVAGYGASSASVPEMARLAMMQMVTQWFSERAAGKPPDSALWILDSFRVGKYPGLYVE